ncbi:hypothetical protein SMRA8_1763 [Stenotrophomonas maltophilia RA8]|jgi:hypothetical protein|nr:hypothetical protein [Thauera aromatica]MCK2094532.1 hypothetical protein [Thauera aromatica]CCP15828.1 hypothetical protein SMRA8_1763 [Stenotrophomonas maltophilia RA8]
MTMTQGAAQWIASIDSRQASPVRTVLQHPWRPTFIPRNIQGIYAALRWQRHIVHRLRLVCPAFAALARHTRIGSRAQSNTHRDTSVSKCNAYIHHMEMSNMHARKSLLALLTTAALSAAGAAHAGPPVAITIKNLGTADAAYSIVGSNETSTYANATPKPAASVPPGATNTYSVQSTISPDVNYAVVRYKIGNKTCVFNTNYVNGYTSGGIKVPSWNKSYTASGGATCTATITSTNISTHAWAVEFTIK